MLYRKHNLYTISLLVLLLMVAVRAGDDCRVGSIDSGYGAAGPYKMAVDSFLNPAYDRRPVYLFRPDGAQAPAPVVFFAHDFGSPDPEEYHGLIAHLTSRGMVVVFPPVPPITFTRDQLLKRRMVYVGFEEACERFDTLIDTTRVGFVGHGFGGGTLPSVARSLIGEKGWGAKGAFLYIMAPWYSYWIDQRQMRAFPPHATMIVQVFEEDDRNSPRIALDIFDNLGIPESEKAFLIMYGDSRGGCRLRANHLTPLSREGFGGEDNVLDEYGIHRMIDALADYSFNDSPEGRRVALGDSSARELTMGRWNDGIAIRRMIATDNPEPYLPHGIYLNPWLSRRNPRVEVTRFRKARKLFVRHRAKKVGVLAKQGKKRIEASLAEESDNKGMANPITEGYGAPAAMSPLIDSFPSPRNEGAWVYVIRPAKAKERLPAVFIFHGYSANHPRELAHLIEHLVSRDRAVVFSPYSILPVANDEETVNQKHEEIFAGMTAAVKRFGPHLDTTRIGFFGQSFGAGAIPRIAYRCITEKGWGTAGAYMFLAAPWYTFGITPEQYASFPDHVKLIVQVYDDDRTNDHQMAVDIFTSIAIPESEKDYTIVYSDSFDGYTLSANHFVPYGDNSINGEENLLDYYGIYRLLDALDEYAFTGDKKAGEVALGNGSRVQRFMGEWPDGTPVSPLEVTDKPRAYHSQLDYLFAWDNPINPRRAIERGEKE
jgi:acetyl esterase/lipase